MGLDSVELIVNFENYFNIQIPDAEAEKIRTVQEMVNCSAKILNISDNGIELKLDIFEKLKSSLIEIGLANNQLSLSDKIFSLLQPKDQESWVKLSEKLSLNIPQPYINIETGIKKIFKVMAWKPGYDWNTITIDQFVTVICACNHEKLIDRRLMKSTYEILIIIIAITTESLGLDPYEVQPDKRFADDFGMD